MKVMAQVAMVMNLDKCIGCHTCSINYEIGRASCRERV